MQTTEKQIKWKMYFKISIRNNRKKNNDFIIVASFIATYKMYTKSSFIDLCCDEQAKQCKISHHNKKRTERETRQSQLIWYCWIYIYIEILNIPVVDNDQTLVFEVFPAFRSESLSLSHLLSFT